MNEVGVMDFRGNSRDRWKSKQPEYYLKISLIYQQI
jgi:hypothetical protein